MAYPAYQQYKCTQCAQFIYYNHFLFLNFIKMSDFTEYKVTTRLRKDAQKVTQVINNNQLILLDRQNDHVDQFHLDYVHSYQDNNQKIYEEMFKNYEATNGTQTSLLFLFIGAKFSGKSYTMLGKLSIDKKKIQQPGILLYYMRRLFTRLRHKTSEQNTIWLQAVQIKKNQMIDIGSILSNSVSVEESNLKQSNSQQLLKVKIQSYSFFQQCMIRLQNIKNNDAHLIIQIFIERQQLTTSFVSSQKHTKITFAQICYEDSNIIQENVNIKQLQSIIFLLQNLRRKERLDHLFQSCRLTMFLRDTFLTAKMFRVIGTLDNSYASNLKTLKYLETSLQQRQDKLMLETIKQEIIREQNYLSTLKDQQRRTLNLLSRCIGFDLNRSERANSKQALYSSNSQNFQNSTFVKKYQKIKYANRCKIDNQEKVKHLLLMLQNQQHQIELIKDSYSRKFQILEKQKLELQQQKLTLKTQQLELKNQKITIFKPNDCLIWSPPINSNQKPKGNSKQVEFGISKQKSKCQLILTQSKEENLHQLGKFRKKRQQQKKYFMQLNTSKQTIVEDMRVQIAKLFQKVCLQQQILQKYQNECFILPNSLSNKLKNRKKEVMVDMSILQQCLQTVKPKKVKPFEKYGEKYSK